MIGMLEQYQRVEALYGDQSPAVHIDTYSDQISLNLSNGRLMIDKFKRACDMYRDVLLPKGSFKVYVDTRSGPEFALSEDGLLYLAQPRITYQLGSFRIAVARPPVLEFGNLRSRNIRGEATKIMVDYLFRSIGENRFLRNPVSLLFDDQANGLEEI